MQVWHIRLFGNLAVSRSGDEFSRFSTRKAGMLLAFLALYRGQGGHSREALCEQLWPGGDPQTSRARLRVVLTSLRRQLEPPGVPAGSVILADGHEQVRLSEEAVTTDVARVERALKLLHPSNAAPMEEQAAAARTIVAHFTHPLLTGLYEDWVVSERERLTQTTVERLSNLARQLPPETGLELARHAAHLDPLAEDPLFALLPLLAQNGQSSEAQRTFRTFRRRWEDAMGGPPSAELRDLAALLSERRSKTSGSPVATLPLRPTEGAAPLSATPSPLPPLARLLPPYLTRFFGREKERQELQLALTETRLVTITGPGGIGKTRLTVETARAWNGPCWFVPLADIREAERLPAALCDALKDIAGTRRPDTDNPEALLTLAANALESVAPAQPLLVLDNLEQIADTAGSLLLALLSRAPSLRLLVSSRLRTYLAGEQEFPLSPLPIPESGAGEASSESERLARVSRVAGVALFLDRARAARPDFQLTTRNREDVLAVCGMLEGIPLAIELVAARSTTLPPSRTRALLVEQGGALRVAGRKTEETERHHSLYTAIEWSYRLLSPDLRRFFAHLSVFRGGFTAEAAAAVCENPDENAAGEALARLRAHSLIESVADDSQMRFSLLESLRAFGAEQLTEEERVAARERHAIWFADLAERFDGAISSGEQASWLERIDSDLSNFREAMEHDLDQNPSRTLQVAGALGLYWNLRGRPTEGRVWLERALSACPLSDEIEEPHAILHRSRALHAAGTLATLQGQGATAQPFFEESLRLRRQGGDRVAIAATLNSLGLLAMARQEWEEARTFFRESLALRRETNATADIAGSLLNLGAVDWEHGDYAAARPLFEEALILFREMGDRIGEGRTLNNLGTMALALEDFAEAEKWFEQSLAIKRFMGTPYGIAVTLSNVGIAAMYQGHYAVAASHFEEALVIFREMNSPDHIADQLRNLAQTATYLGDWDRASSLLAESMTIVRASETPDDIAGNLEGAALLAATRGEAEVVPYLLGAADRIRLETSCPLYPAERAAVDSAAALARTTLGEEQFATAWQEGVHLSTEDAVKLALKSPH